jgi:hypothetical protein
MDFAFYDEIGGRSASGAALLPVRRAIRRVMRPTLYRLRDLLQFLFDKHREDRTRIEQLERQVAALQTQLAAYRPLVADYVGVTRRVAELENQLLRTLAEPRPVVVRNAA